MGKMRRLVALGLMLASTAAWAQTTDGLIVTVGDTEQQFAIGDVKEITFADEGLTVVRTDEATVEFAAGWQIRFGEVDCSGISSAGAAGGLAQVFDAEGKQVKELRLSDLRLGDLPKGVYIVRCNGKSFKAVR